MYAIWECHKKGKFKLSFLALLHLIFAIRWLLLLLAICDMLYMFLAIWIFLSETRKNLFLSLVVVRLVIFILCVHKIMDPNPTDTKLDMLRSKTSYWYNEMYVNINIAFGIIRWKILKQNPTDITIIWCK